MAKIGIIGCGAWGTALAKIAAENLHEVTLWCHKEEIASSIHSEHINSQLLPGIVLPSHIRATTQLDLASQNQDLVVLVTTSRHFKSTLIQLKSLLSQKTLILSATKGLDPTSLLRPSEMLQNHLGNEFLWALLSGPNLSREIAQQKASTTVISSQNEEVSKIIQSWLSRPYFRVYTNTDVIGTELGGTLKNIIAIAAGVADGLELGSNAKSALMVRGIAEMVRFGLKFGAKEETFYGLTGMGDLIATCSSSLSRNHTVGFRLSRGESLTQILSSTHAVAEGVETSRLIHELAAQHQIAMPVTEAVYRLLFENKSAPEVLSELMSRSLTSER